MTAPRRPLRANRWPMRPHNSACGYSWVEMPPTEWNDAQRAERDRCVFGGPPTPEYTEGCPGCEDLIGWRQWRERSTRLAVTLRGLSRA